MPPRPSSKAKNPPSSVDKPYRWESWAAPKDKAGKLDDNDALSGDDLGDFVNGKLFPYLHGFKQRAGASNTIDYKSLSSVNSTPFPPRPKAGRIAYGRATQIGGCLCRSHQSHEEA